MISNISGGIAVIRQGHTHTLLVVADRYKSSGMVGVSQLYDIMAVRILCWAKHCIFCSLGNKPMYSRGHLMSTHHTRQVCGKYKARTCHNFGAPNQL